MYINHFPLISIMFGLLHQFSFNSIFPDAPVILPESSCTLNGDVVMCHCDAEASPKASISWTFNRNDTRPPLLTSVSYIKDNVVSGVIHVPVENQINVSCTAWNQFGSDSKQLPYNLLNACKLNSR